MAFGLPRLRRGLCGEGAAGADIVGRLLPAPGDYFVLEPRRSAFFQTPLALLLERLEVRSVTVMGVAADACVLMTALDALMHRYEVAVVSDAVAAQSSARAPALDLLRTDDPVKLIRTRAALQRLDT
jgi:nicotinamidase-related amidase